MNPKIHSIASAVPETLWSNDHIAELTGADPDFIAKKVGVESCYFLNGDESGTDLAKSACEKLFSQTSYSASDIELIIFVTQTPDYKIPQSSAILHEKLGLNKTCGALDISLGCSGFVYALSAIKGMMISEGLSKAVLVTCDPYSKIMDKHDKNTLTVFGDAATATLLTEDGVFDIGRTDWGTDGHYESSLKIQYGGGNHPIHGIHELTDDSLASTAEATRLNMKGREVFNFVVKNVPLSIEKCLEKNSCDKETIDWFALHQGSKHMLDYMSQRGGIPDEKMLRNIGKYGNTVSSTVPMLLEDLLASNSMKKGTKVLISGFGVGLSWATNILTFNN